MFFFEYLIKLLMGSSNGIFMGLLVVIFGYYGWLLWNIHHDLNSFYNKWEIHQEDLSESKDVVLNIEKEIARLDRMERRIDELDETIDGLQESIIKEIDEESANIREVVKIVVGQYRKTADKNKDELKICRKLNDKQGGDRYRREEESR